MIRGKVSIKTIIMVVVMLLVGVLAVLLMNTAKTFLSSASADFEPKSVVATPGEDGKSAVVSWQSDKASMGVVEYGATPASLLLRAVESTETTSHRISLSPLKSNISYYYRIRVGEEVYDNNGIPFSFKTKEAGASEAVEDSGALVPTLALAPTTAAPTVNPGASGTCNRTTDYNADGTINSLDYLTCIRSGGGSGSGTTPMPTMASGGVVKPNDCSKTDYDKNGVVNSVDRIKCLQNQ